MKTIEVAIEDLEMQMLNINSNKISFPELIEKISIWRAKQALLRSNEIADNTGLNKMTAKEINAEIQKVRDAKNRSWY